MIIADRSTKLDAFILKALAAGDYVVTSDGRIIRYTGSVQKGTMRKDNGYVQVKLRFEGTIKTALYHRVVALALIANPENKPEVNHKDGDKERNHPVNLEWATRQEQELHAHALGLKNFVGVNNNGCVHTETTIREIKALLAARSLPQVEIARRFGITPQTVCNIKKGRIWGSVCLES